MDTKPSMDHRNKLKENISLTSQLVKRLQQNHKDYNRITKKPLNFNFGYHVLSLMVCFCFIFYLIIFLGNTVFAESEVITKLDKMDFSDFITWYSILIVFFYIFSYVIINKVAFKTKIKKNFDRLNEIIEEKPNLINQLKTQSLVPEDYWNIYALNKFEKYINNQRADSLKEVINLFEQEERHEQQIKEMKIMQSIQQATYKKTKEIAAISWINLLK
ncbi:hypothetical protein [Ornithinibacillus bavariensis]|uniref:hypothetical protein n=1 Tax=Ornithinibacillus bavariensis TaxID=545502 RepID=UPI000EEB9CA5|nr:hypothetical protein [Ornithinibacillus sp.]